MVTPTVREICDKAADLLSDGHWCQNSYMRRGGDLKYQYCAAGALSEAATRLSERGERNLGKYHQARIYVERFLGIPAESITYWNDDPARTENEVISVLRSIAHQ
jgi:hypothetical protein